MNPLASEAVASVLRSVLKLGAGYLVARGVWTQDEATNYVAAAALALVSLAWSYYNMKFSRQKLMTATAMAGVTENQVQEMVKDKDVPTPPATVPKDQVAQMPPPESPKVV